jgi:hypothetical protein
VRRVPVTDSSMAAVCPHPTPLPLERTVGVMVDLRVRGQSRLVREPLQPLAGLVGLRPVDDESAVHA